MREQIADLVGVGLLVALGIALAVGSVQYELFGEEGRIAPGFMPFVAGILLVVFSGMVGLETWWRRARDSRETTGEREPQADPVAERAASSEATEHSLRERIAETDEDEGSNRSILFVFGLTLVAILLVPVLGFLVSFGLLVVVLVAFVEREGILMGLVLGAGAVLVSWLVFIQLLQIPVPQGIFQPIIGG